MRRRDVLVGAGPFAAGISSSFPAPAIAQGNRQLKMVTDWPDGTPGLHTSAVRLAKTIGDKNPTYRYEREVENFFRHSPAVVRND